MAEPSSPARQSKPLQPLRCLLYDAVMYPLTLLLAVTGLPCLLSRHATDLLGRIWVAIFFTLNRRILRITCDFKPTYNSVPTENSSGKRGVIIAAKHQSAWETLALRRYYPNAVSVAKQELFWLPFGWYMWRLGFIPLNRGGQTKALQKMMKAVKQRLDAGYDVIIYPEGTRRLWGASPAYKTGIYGVYRYANAQVLPLALDSGRVWGRRPLYRQPGEVRLCEAEQIKSGLDKQTFMAELEQRIETACKLL